jgi:plasmid maintenance system antidote protein VapI
MYPNLNAEIARLGWTVQDLAERSGIPYSSLIPMINGQRSIKISVAKKIKEAIGSGFTIDYLFETQKELRG